MNRRNRLASSFPEYFVGGIAFKVILESFDFLDFPEEVLFFDLLRLRADDDLRLLGSGSSSLLAFSSESELELELEELEDESDEDGSESTTEVLRIAFSIVLPAVSLAPADLVGGLDEFLSFFLGSWIRI